MTIPTPTLDAIAEGLSEDLTVVDFLTAVRELEALGWGDDPLTWTRVGWAWGSHGRRFKDECELLLETRTEIEREEAGMAEPGTELARRHSCTCGFAIHPNDPSGITANRSCELHGEDRG